MAKNKKDENEDALSAKLDRWWEADSAARKNLDWQWFGYDLFVSGNHYAKWNKNTQQIVPVSKNTGAKVTINKTYTTLRSVRNYVLRNKPKPEVTPYNLNDQNMSEAIAANKYLEYIHDKLHLRTKLKGTVWSALKYSTGWWQVLWNDEAEDGLGEIEINDIDNSDLYWDSEAKSPRDAKRVTLAVRRYIDVIKEDPKYQQYKKNFEKIQTDDQLSASTMKARLLQFEKGYSGGGDDKDDGKTIVRETMFYEGTGQDRKVRIVTKAGGQIIRDEVTEMKSFGYFRLPCDVDPMSMYGQGWVKHLIPANKLLNAGESSIAQFNDIMNKGKYITDKGAGVRTINNEHGQIIEKKRGFEVTTVPIPTMSAAQPMQIERANTYIEDIGGAHDASLGRIPSGVHSGKALEALQQGDSNNMSEIVENVEEFLEDVYEYVLALCAEKYQTTRNILSKDDSGVKEFMTVIGEKAASVDQSGTPGGAAVIQSKNIVDVKITSWLAHTPEARREAIGQLAQILNAQQAPLDPQTILEAYETGNIADIVQRIKQQQAENMQQQSQMQQTQLANQQVSQVAGQQMSQDMNQPPAAGAQEAIAALRMLLNGKQPKPPTNPAPEFIQYIDQFLQSPEAQSLDPKTLQQIQVFRDQVQQAPTQQKPPAPGR